MRRRRTTRHALDVVQIRVVRVEREDGKEPLREAPEERRLAGEERVVVRRALPPRGAPGGRKGGEERCKVRGGDGGFEVLGGDAGDDAGKEAREALWGVEEARDGLGEGGGLWRVGGGEELKRGGVEVG